MKSEKGTWEVLRWNLSTEHKELHIAETISLPTGPDERNDGKRWLFVVYRARVIDAELLDITERWDGVTMPFDVIVNHRNTGDSSGLHGHEIHRQRYRTRDEWVEKMAGVEPEGKNP